MYVVGTAGHVDHGKSTLVRALTGIDPDRLREEKERGLTIDLGFAWLELPSGREVGIVDVPGHERFIKNMLAGAGGVDLALLVIAADEGVMPQTREHLAILGLLDVPAGLVVLTKCDLVEDDFLDLVEADVEDALAGSVLAGAIVVRVSAASGAGLPALVAAIDGLLDVLPPKRDLGRARLPIDRAFQVQGFGTVVTGTLVDGSLEIGQEVELQPGRLRARVRGLQRHRTKVERLAPGTRAAVNLSGVHLEDIRRGMVLARPGTVVPARVVDVHLRATQLTGRPLMHDAGLTFLCATAESEAKLRLLDAAELAPGAEGWAQLVLETPVAVALGDHCVLRTANDTVAGGRVVAVNPRRHRRNDPAVTRDLELRLGGSLEERLLDRLHTSPATQATLGSLLAASGPETDEAVGRLKAAGEVVEREGTLFAAAWMAAAGGRLADALQAYLAANPLRGAVPREHVRAAIGLEAVVFDVVVSEAVAAGRCEARGSGLAPAGYEVALPPAQAAAAADLLRRLREGGASPPTDGLPPAALLSYLAERGQIEVTAAGVVFDRAVYEGMVARTVDWARANGSITLAEARDLFGTSRKYAQAFLEHLDERRVLRRVGDGHVLRDGP